MGKEEQVYKNGTLYFCKYQTCVQYLSDGVRSGEYYAGFNLLTYGFLRKKGDNYVDCGVGREVSANGIIAMSVKPYDFGAEKVTMEMIHDELAKIEVVNDLWAVTSSIFCGSDEVSFGVDEKFRPSDVLRVHVHFDYQEEIPLSFGEKVVGALARLLCRW